VDKNKVPHPLHSLGKVVTIRWGKPATLTGEVRKIELIDPGMFDWLPEERRISAKYYQRRNIYYTVYANGHGRWVPEDYIVG